ncbi:YmaF family protein [Clostridium sp. DJ247]|uniref:YmaF family protein n=1 Tax=Clostridium sp. DJ247 TaxID=2726188 RepID=UPI0037BE912C
MIMYNILRMEVFYMHCHDHKHCYSGKTSCECNHRHHYKGKTTEAPDNVPHVHIVEGWTSHEDGHKHYYCIQTSVDCPAPGGGHYHLIRGEVKAADGHIHFIDDKTDKKKD